MSLTADLGGIFIVLDVTTLAFAQIHPVYVFSTSGMFSTPEGAQYIGEILIVRYSL